MHTLTSILAGILLLVFGFAAVIAFLNMTQLFCDAGFNMELAATSSLLLSAGLARLVLWLLDCLHAWAYRGQETISSHLIEDSANAPNLLQALVAALGTAWHWMTVPLIAAALYAMLLLPWFLLEGKNLAGRQGFLIGFSLNVVWLYSLGWLLETAYCRATLYFMGQCSKPPGSSASLTQRGSTRALPSKRRINGSTQPKLSKRAEAQYKSGRLRRRLIGARAMIAPLMGLLGMLVVNTVLPEPSQDQLLLVLLSVWLFIIVGRWLLGKLARFVGKPLYLVQLAISLYALLPIFTLTTWLTTFSVLAKASRPDLRWAVATLPAYRFQQTLGSASGFWVLIFLLLPLSFMAATTITVSTQWTVVCFAAALITYLFVHRLLEHLLQRTCKNSPGLVYLRVFGDSGQSRFVLQNVLPRWRGIGNAICIAAPDVSSHQLGADEALDTLFGQVQHRFLGDDMDLWRMTLDGLGAGVDQPQMAELHCFDDTWKQAVSGMMKQKSIVLMDLRGFSADNLGCSYEIGVLHNMMSLNGIVFLVDDSTHMKVLDGCFSQAWQHMDKHSPNTGKDSGRPTFFTVEKADGQTACNLIRVLCEAHARNWAHQSSCVKAPYQELIEAVRLLAADPKTQMNKVGSRNPGKIIYHQALCLMPDLDGPSHMLSYGFITEDQLDAIHALWNTVEELPNAPKTARALETDTDWQRVREQARSCLKVLGKLKT